MTNEGASEGSRIPSQGHCCLPEGPDECRLGGADTRRVEERGQESFFWQRRQPHRGALRPVQWRGDLVKLRHYPERRKFSGSFRGRAPRASGMRSRSPLFFRLQGPATTEIDSPRFRGRPNLADPGMGIVPVPKSIWVFKRLAGLIRQSHCDAHGTASLGSSRGSGRESRRNVEVRPHFLAVFWPAP